MSFRPEPEEDEHAAATQLTSDPEKRITFKPRQQSKKTGEEKVERIKYVPERPRSRSRERSPAGEQRPLRRGEQGKTVEEIAKFQQAGFVMSGSRSSRMNAMRALKEAEAVESNPQSRIAESARREEDIVDHFRHLWQSRAHK